MIMCLIDLNLGQLLITWRLVSSLEFSDYHKAYFVQVFDQHIAIRNSFDNSFNFCPIEVHQFLAYYYDEHFCVVQHIIAISLDASTVAIR